MLLIIFAVSNQNEETECCRDYHDKSLDVHGSHDDNTIFSDERFFWPQIADIIVQSSEMVPSFSVVVNILGNYNIFTAN